MQREEQIRILTTLQEGIENNTSADAGGIVRSPVTDYTSVELLRREQQVFFRETPLLLGLSADIPNSGDYVATRETGIPILLTRDDAGEFRAFMNVCRHRGAQPVADGRGNRDRFSCPFHAWTYSNRGDLIAINREARFGCIDKATHGLVPLPAEERHGMLWIKPTTGGKFDVDELLGGLGGEMEAWGLATHEYVEEQVLDADINWKLAIDTFGENYHFDVLHRESLAPAVYANLQTSDAFGMNYRMVFATKGGFQYVADNKLPIEGWPYRHITLNVYFLYPNVIFLVDGYGIDLLRIYPDANDPSRSRTVHSSFVHPETKASIAAERKKNQMDSPMESRFVGFNRIIVEEDYRMAASTQVGAASGAQTHYTFGRNEPALHHYHNAHRRGLGLPELKLIEA